jgi:hypothetical protein
MTGIKTFYENVILNDTNTKDCPRTFFTKQALRIRDSALTASFLVRIRTPFLVSLLPLLQFLARDRENLPHYGIELFKLGIAFLRCRTHLISNTQKSDLAFLVAFWFASFMRADSTVARGLYT